MSLRLLFIILSLFITQGLQAQSIIMIEDQSKTGFKLVVNGYLQNEVFLERVNIKDLPSGELKLLVELKDGRILRKELPNLGEGKHQYVVFKNFDQNLKLRYRGSYSELKQSAVMLAFTKDQLYQASKEVLASTVLSDLPQADSLRDIREAVPQDSIVAEGNSTPIEVKSSPVSSPKMETDSLPIATAATPATKDSTAAQSNSEGEPKTAIVDAFSEELNQVKNSNFEFDKLQIAKRIIEVKALDNDQLAALLAQFKYDQTRLDLLQGYRQIHPKTKLGIEVLNSFDYELSKQSAQKIIDETNPK